MTFQIAVTHKQQSDADSGQDSMLTMTMRPLHVINSTHVSSVLVRGCASSVDKGAEQKLSLTEHVM